MIIAGVGVACVLAVILGSGGGGGSYRVAAVFDTANGIEARQQVKIAGAVVGSVAAVELAPGPKALIVMNVSRRFAPFRRTASCTILPEGIISESYVECNPGTRRDPPLTTTRRGFPVVPVQHTANPTTLQEMLNVFSGPTDERLRVLIDQLGIATAGRGEDINAILRRSNPALDQAQRLLGLIDSQRAQLADGVAQTGRILASLTDRSIRAFLSSGAAVSRTTAAHRSSMTQAMLRLPPLLTALRPGLASLDRVLVAGTPVLESLRAAAPDLLTTTRAVPDLVAAGTPTLHHLEGVAVAGERAVTAANPLVSDLRIAAGRVARTGPGLDRFLINLRDNGALEGLETIFYSLSTLAGGYDSFSHFFNLVVNVLPQCFASATSPGCPTAYNSPGQGTIPPDDPACGPRSGALWDPPTNCRSHTQILSLIRRPDHHAPPPGAPAAAPPGRTRPLAPEGPLPSTPRSATSGPTATTPMLPPAASQAPSAIQQAVNTPLSAVSPLLHYLLGK